MVRLSTMLSQQKPGSYFLWMLMRSNFCRHMAVGAQLNCGKLFVANSQEVWTGLNFQWFSEIVIFNIITILNGTDAIRDKKETHMKVRCK